MPSVISKIHVVLKNSEQRYALSSALVKAIITMPIVILFICFLFWVIPAARPLGLWLLQENHPVEILTFMSLFMAGFVGLQLSWALKNQIKEPTKKIFIVGFYIIFSLGLIFVSMEEVSWGQWIFGFKTPEFIEATNKQGEFNFHNIEGFNQSFELLRVLFGVGGLIGIALSSWSFTKEIAAAAILAPWFVIIAVLATLDLQNYYTPITCCPYTGSIFNLIAAYLVEVLELLIGFSALLYMWLNERILFYTKGIHA